MVECKPLETLWRWVAGDLPPAEAVAVRAHVHHCAACQAALDRNTEDSDLRPWLAARERRVGATLDQRVLDRLVVQLQANRPLNEEPERAELAGPATPASAPCESPVDLGAVGPYRLLNELGRGGMGIVYRAWDEPLRRLVAVKVLRPDQAEESDRLRLVREAQLTAQFRHDHAVMVHAFAYPEGGLPYLVMEYVEGSTLAQLIDSAARPASRVVANWVSQVADALDAAHAAGLIHRDVKPSNILIEDRTGRAKITDFGLARSETGPSSLSREGFLAGTPTYMSPEQARSEASLDARTDVYGLGATFYQALTGVTPYRGAPHLVLRQVIEEDPRPPRQLNDQVPRDLETICLKAMAREPARRYQTAGALADDLRHWLRDEPIRARPVSRIERGYRWCRRNPRVAGLAAALLLVFTAGFLGVVWQWRRAELHLKESQISFERARGAVDQFYTRFYEQGVLAVPGLEKVRHDVLGEMIHYYTDFVDQHRNDPALRRELAETCRRIGMLTKDQGNQADAIVVLRRAIQYFEGLAAHSDEDRSIQMGLYGCLHNIAQLEFELGDVESAQRDYLRGFGILERVVQKEPGNLDLKRGLAATQGNLANLFVKMQDKTEARRAYLRALDILKDLVQRDPADVAFKNDLALTYNNLLYVTDSDDEKRALLEQSLTLRKQLVETLPGNTVFRRHLARTYMNLGVHQEAWGQIQDALSSLRESRALLHQVVIEVPNVTIFQDNLGTTCEILGKMLLRQGQHREALDAYKEARTTFQKLVQSNGENGTFKYQLVEVETRLAECDKALKATVTGSPATPGKP
jgi:eukaryotic-like serine/threonine-protein kinase